MVEDETEQDRISNPFEVLGFLPGGRNEENISRRKISVMIHKPEPPSLESQLEKKNKSFDYSEVSNLFSQRWVWLAASILTLQSLFMLIGRSVPGYFTHTPSPISTSSSVCDEGRVYVYELPSMFNLDLINDCDGLNPWRSQCKAFLNKGFGHRATGLDGIVPENLRSSWYVTDQFSSEVIYHNRMLQHRCRTLDPHKADAFFVPFYAGLAVGKYLWLEYSSKDRDLHGEKILEWLQNQTYFTKSNGWDHFMMLGRITWDFRRSKDGDWGGSFIYMPAMQNVTRLLIERNPWDEFDVGVPYPTGFHPNSCEEIWQWQRYVANRTRSTLFGFAGATRSAFKDDFRTSLLSECEKESSHCRSVDCSENRCLNGNSASLELFLDSEFCLQPRGDSFTRRSIFDCMIAGSIPVFFWRRSAYLQYMWHLPAQPTSYSVFIDRREVKNGTSIRAVLEGLGEENKKKMRDKIVQIIPKLIYVAPEEGINGISDAFDVAVEGVVKRFRQRSKGL